MVNANKPVTLALAPRVIVDALAISPKLTTAVVVSVPVLTATLNISIAVAISKLPFEFITKPPRVGKPENTNVPFEVPENSRLDKPSSSLNVPLVRL